MSAYDENWLGRNEEPVSGVKHCLSAEIPYVELYFISNQHLEDWIRISRESQGGNVYAVGTEVEVAFVVLVLQNLQQGRFTNSLYISYYEYSITTEGYLVSNKHEFDLVPWYSGLIVEHSEILQNLN